MIDKEQLKRTIERILLGEPALTVINEEIPDVVREKGAIGTLAYIEKYHRENRKY